MKKNIFYLLIVLIFNFNFAMAQTDAPDPDDENSSAESTANNDDANFEKETNEYEEKLDSIRYGLNSDVIKLVQTLQEENDERFTAELVEVFNNEKNIDLKKAVLALFISQENDALKLETSEIISNFDDYEVDFIKACIQYLTEFEIKNSEIVQILHEIIDGEKDELKEIAVLALGKLGESDDAVYLTEIFEEYVGDDTFSLVLRQAIMQALIDLKADETFDFLENIVADTYENSIVRARGITAMGKIGRTEAMEILSNAFTETDPAVREAVVAGLSGFEGNAEAEKILLLAFKDEYYKVRLMAIDIARETNNANSIPFILYRAKNDPETIVKNHAVEALAKTDNSEALDWLVQTFEDEAKGTDLRIKIATTLLQNNSGLIINEIETAILNALNEKSQKRFAYNLGKKISGIEESGLVRVCEAFLMDPESMYKSIGLDMFKTNHFTELISLVESIAKNKKNGALQKRAKQILESSGTIVSEDEFENTSEPSLTE